MRRVFVVTCFAICFSINSNSQSLSCRYAGQCTGPTFGGTETGSCYMQLGYFDCNDRNGSKKVNCYEIPVNV